MTGEQDNQQARFPMTQVGWLGPYGLIPGGMDNEPSPKWRAVYVFNEYGTELPADRTPVDNQLLREVRDWLGIVAYDPSGHDADFLRRLPNPDEQP